MADLQELTIRMGLVEKGLESEIEKRERANKYTHNMVEDVQSRYSDIALDIGTLKAAVAQHIIDDAKMSKAIDDMAARLADVQRMVWIAVGGTTIIAALVIVVLNRIAALVIK